ncbi:hypothetical protein AMS68_006098 [Peltaster fructicola]|uniref:U3 small nucleolar RNA-associated protein 22 n=1 Tax=Peltaster fructicola TaxID=286661 RepID=A0A6H0Y0Y4_9PEZI|nr:hypothetical protein AMS68_006098 [Peltaster fructicola]
MSKARKRQKTEHVSSEEEDDASFASFSGTDAIEDAEQQDLAAGSDGESQTSDVDQLQDAEESYGDDDDEEMEDNAQPHLEESTANRSRTIGHQKTAHVRSTFQGDGTGKSSMLKAQITQLLQQLRPKHTAREVEAEEALHLIKTTIDVVPAQGPFTLDSARKVLMREKVAIPFPSPAPAEDSNLKFAYEKPSSINVVGSYPMKTANRARKFLYVDMVAQMPSSLFTEKDYLDFRYFHKRAFYLAVIASSLRVAHSNDLDIRFQSHHDDQLRPIVTIRPRRAVNSSDSGKPTRDWQINILPAVAADLFPSTKLLPTKNCMRKGKVESVATPSYNSSIRADMLVTAYLKLLHKTSTTCEAYKDACSLGSTWLRQRGFRATSRKGGIASFEWSALLALLLTSGGPNGRAVLSERWDSMQLFKATLQFLATRDLVKQPVIIGDGTLLDSTSLELPIVWDAVRAHNIFHKLQIWSYKKLQIEAKLTLTMLGDQQFSGFEAAFITRKDVDLLNNDVVIELRIKEAPTQGQDIYSKLYDTLRRGLGDRIKAIELTAERSKPWKLDAAHVDSNDNAIITIGLTVNADTVNRAVDHGPSVEDKVASAAFRTFWGDKSELRRFKDGSITEALIWDTGAGKAAVLEQVVRYVLQQHLYVTDDAAVTFSVDMETRLLGMRSSDASQAMAEAFKLLEQDIRSLEGFPLPIRQIVPAAMDRTSSKSTKDKHTLSMPRDVVLQFESSGRWPDDLAAIQRTKIAFLLKFSELLHDSGKPLSSRVGLENQEHDIRNQGCLDIVYESGAAFRIRIFHDREQTLLERQLKNKTLDAKTVELAASALAVCKRDYVKRPGHAQAIAQLCSRYPALKGTIRILERWLAQHVLANHFDVELIELFAARTFVQPWPWPHPSSVQTGFLRTIAWLARWDWRFEPLIVDMSSTRDMKSATMASIRTRFEAWRKLDPAFNRVTVFAASNVDVDGTTYSTDRPSKVVVSRLNTLARAALEEIQTQGLKLDYRTLFTSSLTDFDFVLHLSPQGDRKTKAAAFKNIELAAASDIASVGYVPVSDLLEELQTAYGSAIFFFSGFPHRMAISGVWTPQTSERNWKVNLTYSTKPIVGTDMTLAQINKTAILAEIARLGGDMIERIEVMKR